MSDGAELVISILLCAYIIMGAVCAYCLSIMGLIEFTWQNSLAMTCILIIISVVK